MEVKYHLLWLLLAVCTSQVLCFCAVDEQRCPNGTCIPESDIQNGVDDCAEGKYDETGPFCNITYQLQCSNGRCISRELFGNGVDDCNDNSDEVLKPCKLGAFSCSNKKCVSITWVLDSMDDCGDGSDEAKRIGTACDDSHCCPCQDYVTDSRCKDKTCQCIDGFYSNEARTTCFRRKFNDSCSVDRDCSEAYPYGICLEGDERCGCQLGYYRYDNFTGCEKRQIGDNTCNIDIDCMSVIANSECVNQTCSCIVGYHPTSDNTKCIKRKIDDPTCTLDIDCSTAVRNSNCTDGTCLCDSGYFASDDKTRCVRWKLGDDCITDEDCNQAITSSVCHDNICRCHQSYEAFNDNTECVKRPRYLGDRCYFQQQCQRIDVNSLCGPDYTCICPSGRFESRDRATCHRLPRYLDELCHTTEQCLENIPNSVCSGDSCSCPEQFFNDRDDQYCQPYAEKIGEKCYSDEHCRNINLTECSNNQTCNCSYGFMASDDLLTCLSRPTLVPYFEPQYIVNATTCDPRQSNACGNDPKRHCFQHGGETEGYCKCIPGYSSIHPHHVCVDVQTYKLEINFTQRAEVYDYLPFYFDDSFNDVYSASYIDVNKRVTLSGINLIMKQSNHSHRFISSELLSITDLHPGVHVSAIFHITENIQNPLQPAVFYQYFQNDLIEKDGEFGDSRLKITQPFDKNIILTDFNECNFTRYNDCSPLSWCINTMSSFMCVCKSVYDDVSHETNERPGRQCVVPTTTPSFSESCSNENCETRWEYVGLALVLFLLLIIGFIVYEIINKKQEISARDIYARFNRATRQSISLLRKGSKEDNKTGEKKRKKNKNVVESSASTSSDKGISNLALTETEELVEKSPEPYREEMEIS